MSTTSTTAPAPVASLNCFNSRCDTFGNCYYAFVWTDNATGRTVCGTISGGESNVRSILYHMNGGNWEPRNVFFTSTELPIREYNRAVKGWPYAGCTGDELAAFIRKGLASA